VRTNVLYSRRSAVRHRLGKHTPIGGRDEHQLSR
jgi:hypothetical protein